MCGPTHPVRPAAIDADPAAADPAPPPIAPALLAWARTLERPMPWRGLRDPYRIWLSEVILQQTRVAQGVGYYERFVAAYPTVHHLAAATETEVLALWQGLGYYSRARNLHRAARRVAHELSGRFPADYAGLLTLPGVGPYTAAAVASFAYDEAVPVVDGNVYRVLARYLDRAEPIDTPAGQRAFRGLAEAQLPPDAPAAYNQAIMDFGATVCTPRAPACATCPLRAGCLALARGTVAERPVKVGKVRRRDRYFDYVDLRVPATGERLLRRRGPKDIWQGLYDFPLVEGAAGFAERPTVEALAARLAGAAATPVRVRTTPPAKHVLSHQNLFLRFWAFEVAAAADVDEPLAWLTPGRVAAVGLPRPVERYLHDSTLALDF